MRQVGGERYDALVLGGGTAGCVVAARLSEDADRSVCLVEAGPDYGPFEDGRWPADLLDPTDPPDSHDWEPGGELSGARCKVIGGCSTHNASFIAWGSRADLDEWEPFGGPDWTFEALVPYLRRGERELCTRPLEEAELNPWALAVRDGAGEIGLPVLDDLNDLDHPEGAALLRVNVSRGARWNTGFAYLDAARARPNLTILPETSIDRVELNGDRAAGAIVHGPSGATELTAETVVVSAGAYGTPPILMRSGIGPEGQLREHGIPVTAPLDGVGQNLVDHAGASIRFEPTERLRDAIAAASRKGRMFRAGTIIRARSARCATDTWDLHLLSWTPLDEEGEWGARISAYTMKPASRGRIRLRSSAHTDLPLVEHGFASDRDGRDLDAIVDGFEIIAGIAAAQRARGIIGAPIGIDPEAAGRSGLAEFVREHVRGYFHPVGTCRMGPSGDPLAVVDGSGRVHGFDNLHVVDASIAPTIPRANTNLIVVAIAERIAELIAEGGSE